MTPHLALPRDIWKTQGGTGPCAPVHLTAPWNGWERLCKSNPPPHIHTRGSGEASGSKIHGASARWSPPGISLGLSVPVYKCSNRLDFTSSWIQITVLVHTNLWLLTISYKTSMLMNQLWAKYMLNIISLSVTTAAVGALRRETTPRSAVSVVSQQHLSYMFNNNLCILFNLSGRVTHSAETAKNKVLNYLLLLIDSNSTYFTYLYSWISIWLSTPYITVDS